MHRSAALWFVGALAAASLALATCRSTETPSEAPVHTPKLFGGLGKIHHPISTQNAMAQRYFDQGLALAYGFNHDGAIDSFREAARLDPKCAICWWGIAFAAGPNINAPMGPDGAKLAFEAAQQARRLESNASPAERDFIDAIQVRYTADFEKTAGAGGSPARIAQDRAFADAMRQVASKHPQDVDAITIFAESLMDLSPWNYWHDDRSPREFTPEAQAALQRALALNPDHTGALHYTIHIYERFEPEKAEAAADRLELQAPDAGHLVHMPAHIYYRVGRYKDSADVNEAAAAADVAYFSWCRAPAAYAALYYTHNLHFLWASAMIEGRSDAALTAARRIVAQVPLDQLSTFPFLEDFLVTPYYTLTRFGKWDAILGEPQPPADQKFVTAIWHYARGLAYTRKGRPADAKVEYEALARIAADPAVASLGYDTSGGTAGQRLAVAQHHLAGEMAAARDDSRTAVVELEEAVRIQDGMPYSEPPPFYFPVRQALGAVLLDAGQPAKAEVVYREDLQRYPRNGWSLYGLSKSLSAQGRRADAQYAATGFQHAFARADVKLAESRF
jgi:tetratricopeptide (TPR) repeat protein